MWFLATAAGNFERQAPWLSRHTETVPSAARIGFATIPSFMSKMQSSRSNCLGRLRKEIAVWAGIGAIQPETASVSPPAQNEPFIVARIGDRERCRELHRPPSCEWLGVFVTDWAVGSAVLFAFHLPAEPVVWFPPEAIRCHLLLPLRRRVSKLCTWSANAIAWHSGELPL